jgi:hypothetical protein
MVFLDFKLSPCSKCCMFYLGNSPASEIYVPTFRNTLFHLHKQVGVCRMNWVRGMLVYHRGRDLA